MIKAFLYDWGGANVWLFHLINNIRGSLIDSFMLLGTQIGDHSYFPYYLSIAILWSLNLIRHNPSHNFQNNTQKSSKWLVAVYVFILCYVIDGAIVGWVKHFFDFPRPPLALPAGTLNVLGTPELHYSLPSGHASFAMLLAASFWSVLNPVGRVFATFLVLWVGLSRISVGAHFPADVLAGWLTSLLIVVIVSAFLNKLLLSNKNIIINGKL